MKTIGVGELRQRASELLEDVKSGLTIEVTVHGRPIARLVPVTGPDRRRQLMACGRLSPGHGDVLRLGVPLRPQRGVIAPGGQLERARANER